MGYQPGSHKPPQEYCDVPILESPEDITKDEDQNKPKFRLTMPLVIFEPTVEPPTLGIDFPLDPPTQYDYQENEGKSTIADEYEELSH